MPEDDLKDKISKAREWLKWAERSEARTHEEWEQAQVEVRRARRYLEKTLEEAAGQGVLFEP